MDYWGGAKRYVGPPPKLLGGLPPPPPPPTLPTPMVWTFLYGDIIINMAVKITALFSLNTGAMIILSSNFQKSVKWIYKFFNSISVISG